MINDYNTTMKELLGEDALFLLNMTPTTTQRKLINDFSQLIYNWKNSNDIENILIPELIIEDVGQMELSDPDRLKVIGIFKQLWEIIKRNDE